MKIIVFFAALAVSAVASATTLDPTAACNRANQYERANCLNSVSNYYISPHAAFACARANQYEVDDCMSNARNAYFTADAATVCSGANQYEVKNCVQAARNKQFTSAEVSQCRRSGQYDKDSCLSRRGTPYLGPVQKATPSEICSRLPDNLFDQCLGTVSEPGNGSKYVDPNAAGYCNRPFKSDLILGCMKAIVGKQYSPDNLALCNSRRSHGEVNACLEKLGTLHTNGGDQDPDEQLCTLNNRRINKFVRKLNRVRKSIRGGENDRALRILNRLEQKAYDCLDGVLSDD